MKCRFFADCSGNFAILFAAGLLPLVAAVTLAVDYTIASTERSELHNAADAAALALARRGNDLEQAEAERIADQYMRANYAGGFSDLNVEKSTTTWTVSVDAEAPTRFAGIFGVTASKVSVESAATFALKTYEIGLVLDTTGSMRGEKLEKLKEAAIALIDTMSQHSGDPDLVKFSIVPFSTFVNVGPQFGPQFDDKGRVVKPAAPWLDARGRNPIDQVELKQNLSRFELFDHLGTTWDGCVETRPAHNARAYDVVDLGVANNEKRSLFVPAFSIDEPDDVARNGRPVYGNSYLADRGAKLNDSKNKRLREKYNVVMNSGGGNDDDDDDDDDDDGGLLGGLVGGVLGLLSDAEFLDPPAVDGSASRSGQPKGPNHDCVSRPIVPLTSDFELLKERIEELEAEGNTNMMEGLMWGWRALSPGEPFAEGRAKSDGENEKVMIFLTDGANTWNQLGNDLGSSYSSFGYAADERLIGQGAGGVAVTNAMDGKTEDGCANAKADGITIYTVRLELRDTGTGRLLSECATSPDHYFDVPDASELEETFKGIAERIRSVRLTS